MISDINNGQCILYIYGIIHLIQTSCIFGHKQWPMYSINIWVNNSFDSNLLHIYLNIFEKLRMIKKFTKRLTCSVDSNLTLETTFWEECLYWKKNICYPHRSYLVSCRGYYYLIKIQRIKENKLFLKMAIIFIFPFITLITLFSWQHKFVFYYNYSF